MNVNWKHTPHAIIADRRLQNLGGFSHIQDDAPKNDPAPGVAIEPSLLTGRNVGFQLDRFLQRIGDDAPRSSIDALRDVLDAMATIDASHVPQIGSVRDRTVLGLQIARKTGRNVFDSRIEDFKLLTAAKSALAGLNCLERDAASLSPKQAHTMSKLVSDLGTEVRTRLEADGFKL